MTTERPVLPPSLRAPFGAISVTGALLAVMLGLLFAGEANGSRFDEWIQPDVETVPTPVRIIALAIDFCGEPLGATILIGALVAFCLALRRFRLMALALVGCGATVAVTTLLKPVVGRTIHDGHLSYPSGHTALATAFAVVAGLLLIDILRLARRAALVLLVVATIVSAAFMAWAQVTLGAHYPTDTLGGFCTALAVLPALCLADARVPHSTT
jgi:membrane-associated phospholipid phosphatase